MTDTIMDTNSKIRLTLVHLLIPYWDMIFEKGMLNATKLIRYIRFTHISISAEKFNVWDILGSATTVMFAISCTINCAIAATISAVLFSEMLMIIPPDVLFVSSGLYSQGKINIPFLDRAIMMGRNGLFR